jgi:hypothetical protein
MLYNENIIKNMLERLNTISVYSMTPKFAIVGDLWVVSRGLAWKVFNR